MVISVAESTAQSRAPLRFSTAVARGLREGAAIALAVLALVLLVALLSFDLDDRGYSTTGGHQGISNRVGPIGAWVADALLSLFGLLWSIKAATERLTLSYLSHRKARRLRRHIAAATQPGLAMARAGG